MTLQAEIDPAGTDVGTINRRGAAPAAAAAWSLHAAAALRLLLAVFLLRLLVPLLLSSNAALFFLRHLRSIMGMIFTLTAFLGSFNT